MRPVVILLVPALIFASVMIIIGFGLTFPVPGWVITGEKWARIPVWGEYLLENNVWGDESSSQYIFASKGLVMWFWSKRSYSPNPVYPEIIFGKKPWLDASTTDKLPARVGDVRSLVVELNYVTLVYDHDASLYNALIDVWITTSEEASYKDITDEVTVVLEGNKPGCIRGEIIEVDGRTYTYIAYKGQWVLHQFILCDGEKPTKLNLMHFIQHAKIPPEYYIASVEFGNEVWIGAGITLLKHFNVAVEKKLGPFS